MQTAKRTAQQRRQCRNKCSVARACVLLVATLAAIMTAAPAQAQGAKKTTAQQQAPTAGLPLTVEYGANRLPVNVAEMREAILAAALSGDIKELLIPIQWNELPPVFGEKSVKETLLDWQKQSHDGSGREMLALLADILSGPYAVRRQGADVENAKIFIWPAVAELPLDKLTPALEVALLRIASGDEVKRMKKAGRYDGYGLAIGADGTWHAFRQVRHGDTKAKP